MRRHARDRQPVDGVQPVGADTLIAYAGQGGSVSYDGVDPTVLYDGSVKHLAEPGLDIRIALGKVRDDVLASTGNKQEPFVYGSLGGADISLVPLPAAPKVEPAPVAADPNAAAAHDYEMAERVGARKAWESFLSLHNSGFYADLARAQLAKLNAAEPAKLPDVAKLPDAPKRLKRPRTPTSRPRVWLRSARPPNSRRRRTRPASRRSAKRRCSRASTSRPRRR